MQIVHNIILSIWRIQKISSFLLSMRLNFPFFPSHIYSYQLRATIEFMRENSLRVGGKQKKMLTKKKKNTISTCLMMILKFAFTIQLFLFLVSFFFIHVVVALPCTWKKLGRKWEVFSCFTKFHIAAGSKSAAVHLIFFFVLTGTVHTPIPFFHLPRTNTRTLSPSTVDFHSV